MAKKAPSKTSPKPAGVKKSPARKPRAPKSVGRDQGPGAVLDTPPPVALGSIVGQDRAIAQLRSAMDSGRLHHAWIFHGPEGVGKFTTALAWAALLLDPTTAVGLTGELGCDEDGPTRRLLMAGTHPDLHVICKELARFSDDKKIRDAKLATIPKAVVEEHLIVPASRAPVMRTESRAGKVFIVDEAELLDRSPSNAPTQNAILKTLEEPAPGTVIVLVTSSEDRLLPTIRSRCQRVAFSPLSARDMETWLGKSGPEAGPEIGAEERAWLLTVCDGSPGRLAALHDSDAYAWHRTIAPMLASAERGVHPLGLGQAMGRLVDDWAGAWVKAGEKLGENRSKDAANRLGARRMLGLVGDGARPGLADPARAGASLRAIEAVGRAQSLLDRNVNMKLVFEHLAATLSGGEGVVQAL